MNEQKAKKNEQEEATDTPGHLLGRLLRTHRDKNKKEQKTVAAHIGVNAPMMSNFEKGQKLPNIEQLAKLSQELDISLEALVQARVLEEVACVAKAETTEEGKKRFCLLMEKLEKQVVAAQQGNASEINKKLSGRTFLDFPEAFSKTGLVIVTGDRRDSPPKGPGDIGAYSASPIDDRWVHMLGLPKTTEKVSDKEFVVSDRERLQELYGSKTLLVLGSPASNHLSRIINAQAIFKFNLRLDFYNGLGKLIEDVRKVRTLGELKDHTALATDLKGWMRSFFAGGIVDPLKEDVRGYAIPGDKDFATITFAVNPYAPKDDFSQVAILVAGFHHPGTAWALRCLAQMEENVKFTDHPYGGVLEVSIDENMLWENRMRSVKPQWDTEAYDKDDLLKALEAVKSKKSALMPIKDEDADICGKLVKGI
jgi:transcriptional regulator with XRE-family HTH domain